MSVLRTLSIGGATFDLFVTIDHRIIRDEQGKDVLGLPLGAKVPVRHVQGVIGGGACNTSVGLSRLGCEAGFCGVMGDDEWGIRLLEGLKKEHVNVSHATIVEKETSSFSLILNAHSGERTILYDAGTNAHLHDVTFDSGSVRTMDWIYLNHIHANSCVIEDDMIALLQKYPEVCLTWNPGGCQIDVGLRASNNVQMLRRTRLLLLNREEALAFAATETVDQALRVLLAQGAHVVCITDGSRGVIASDGKQRVYCPSLAVKAVDVTGAGDAFGCAMTWAIASKLDLPTAMIAGTLNAASVVSAIGAQAGLLTDSEMRSRLARHTLAIECSSVS